MSITKSRPDEPLPKPTPAPRYVPRVVLALGDRLPLTVVAPDSPSVDEPPDDKQYRVWWIPQNPGKAFYVLARDLETAYALTIVLAQYDLFQYDNKIKPDYSNTGEVEHWDEIEREWSDVAPEDIDALENQR